MGKLYDNLVRNYENISEEEWREIESLNEIGPDVIEYANWIEDYKNKLEIKYFELFKKAREKDKQELIAEACRWLNKTLFIYTEDDDRIQPTEWVTSEYNTIDEFISDFKKAMEDLK